MKKQKDKILLQFLLPYSTKNANLLKRIQNVCNAKVWISSCDMCPSYEYANIEVIPYQKNLKKIEKILKKTLDKSDKI